MEQCEPNVSNLIVLESPSNWVAEIRWEIMLMVRLKADPNIVEKKTKQMMSQ